ncbi:MAG: metallophosphatase domain-containing protein [Rikenellaceae bacterium]
MYRLNYKGLKIIAISDTHGRHRELKIPKCDVLIHLGDVCNFGEANEIMDFIVWFSELPIKHRIYISGNHDTMFESQNEYLASLIDPCFFTFLENEVIEIEGVRFSSVPIRFKDDDTEWVDIEGADILLTHCPPFAVFDEGYGSRRLLEYVSKYQPAYHLFGHVHQEKPGSGSVGRTTFVNVSQKL